MDLTEIQTDICLQTLKDEGKLTFHEAATFTSNLVTRSEEAS